MSRRCCCPACTALLDTFNRANSPTVSGWTEIAGTWSIAGNRLREAGTADALIRADTPVFYRGEMQIVVQAMDFATGDKYRICVDWVHGTSNYYYAEYEKLAALDTWRVSVLDKTDNVLDTEDIVAPPGVAGQMGLIACFIGGHKNSARCHFLADLDFREPGGLFPWDIVVPNRGKYSGLGNGGSSQIEYDQYVLTNPDTVNRDCVSCWCFCDGYTIPKVLTATFSGYLAWECVDGVTVTLTYDKSEDGWLGTLANKWDLKLTCADGTQPKGGAMCLDLFPAGVGIDVDCCANYFGDTDIGETCVGDPALSCSVDSNYDSTCDPIVLNYGPWTTVPSDLSCSPCGGAPGEPGGFSIVVTE